MPVAGPSLRQRRPSTLCEEAEKRRTADYQMVHTQTYVKDRYDMRQASNLNGDSAHSACSSTIVAR